MADHAATTTTNSGLVLSDGMYNFLRQLVEKGFPGLGVLYAALAVYWHWGHEVEVVGTLSAIAVFGGLMLTLARKGYNVDPTAPPGGYDGAVVEDVSESGEPILRLQLDPEASANIMNKSQLVIKGYDASA